eukprot:scaffold14402_cov30-Tisochrysis_lutea.AAC.4
MHHFHGVHSGSRAPYRGRRARAGARDARHLIPFARPCGRRRIVPRAPAALLSHLIPVARASRLAVHHVRRAAVRRVVRRAATLGRLSIGHPLRAEHKGGVAIGRRHPIGGQPSVANEKQGKRENFPDEHSHREEGGPLQQPSRRHPIGNSHCLKVHVCKDEDNHHNNE